MAIFFPPCFVMFWFLISIAGLSPNPILYSTQRASTVLAILLVLYSIAAPEPQASHYLPPIGDGLDQQHPRSEIKGENLRKLRLSGCQLLKVRLLGAHGRGDAVGLIGRVSVKPVNNFPSSPSRRRLIAQSHE